MIRLRQYKPIRNYIEPQCPRCRNNTLYLNIKTNYINCDHCNLKFEYFNSPITYKRPRRSGKSTSSILTGIINRNSLVFTNNTKIETLMILDKLNIPISGQSNNRILVDSCEINSKCNNMHMDDIYTKCNSIMDMGVIYTHIIFDDVQLPERSSYILTCRKCSFILLNII